MKENKGKEVVDEVTRLEAQSQSCLLLGIREKICQRQLT